MKFTTLFASLALFTVGANAAPAGDEAKPKDSFIGHPAPLYAVRCICKIAENEPMDEHKATKGVCKRAYNTRMVEAKMMKHGDNEYCVLTRTDDPWDPKKKLTDTKLFNLFKDNLGHITRCMGEHMGCRDYVRYSIAPGKSGKWETSVEPEAMDKSITSDWQLIM